MRYNFDTVTFKNLQSEPSVQALNKFMIKTTEGCLDLNRKTNLEILEQFLLKLYLLFNAKLLLIKWRLRNNTNTARPTTVKF